MTDPATRDDGTGDDPADGELAGGELGGGAACDLHRVCDACGALEDGPPAPVCGRCGRRRSR